MKRRYKFTYRSEGAYHWVSELPVEPGDSRYDHVRCPVNWFWGGKNGG